MRRIPERRRVAEMRVEKLIDIQEYFHSGKAGSCPKCGRGEGCGDR